MESNQISRKLLKRLPIYLNYLKSLPGEDQNISATAIAAALGLGHVQVRKDLAKVAHEGRRRTGRSRDQLIRDIESYLDFMTATSTIIVGTGTLGQVLLDYSGFEESGLNIMAGFDSQPTMKKSESGKPIYAMSRLSAFCKYYDVRIGIIAVPAEEAQAVCDDLIACGIQAIWNFTPVHLKVPKNVVIQSQDMSVSINTLRMQLRSNGNALPPA